MNGPGQNVAALQVGSGPQFQGTGHRAEDDLTALERIQQAYRNGIVNANDLLSLMAKPAETKARIDTSRDASSAARANMEIRPLATQAAREELLAEQDVRPRATALKKAKIDDEMGEIDTRSRLRPGVERVASKKLDEDTFDLDVKASTRGARAATAGSDAEAERILASGKAALAPDQVAAAGEKLAADREQTSIAAKDPYNVRRAMIAELTKYGAEFDPQNDSDAELRKKFRAARAESRTAEIEFEKAKTRIAKAPDTIVGIRKELEANNTLKEFRDSRAALAGIETTLSAEKPSGEADLAAIYQFVKILDPGSVVRESEIKLSQSAIPAVKRFAMLYHRLATGQQLTPEARQGYLRVARDLTAAKERSAKAALAPYAAMVNDMELPEEQVFGDYERALINGSSAAESGQSEPLPMSDAAAVPPGNTVMKLKDGRKIILDASGRYVGPAR